MTVIHCLKWDKMHSQSAKILLFLLPINFGEDDLDIIIRENQRMIQSKKFQITDRVTVDEFLSKIVKCHKINN